MLGAKTVMTDVSVHGIVRSSKREGGGWGYLNVAAVRGAAQLVTREIASWVYTCGKYDGRRRDAGAGVRSCSDRRERPRHHPVEQC